jgi:uncharacterized membrane protein
MEDFSKKLQMEIARERANQDAYEKSLKAKDIILEHMAGIYFRVEQMKKVSSQKNITVAEVVNKMPDSMGQIVQAVKFAWRQDYMVDAFYKIMKEDGESVDPNILGNLSAIDAPSFAPIARPS